MSVDAVLWRVNMANEEDFKTNTEIFTTARDHGVDIEAFKAFADRFGIEQAKGYFQAVHDLLPKIELIALGKKREPTARQLIHDITIHDITDKERKEWAKALLDHMEQFLKIASTLDIIQDHIDTTGANYDHPTP